MDDLIIPATMTPWHGAKRAPADWDGGPVLLRDGRVYEPATTWWHNGPYSPDLDIIAYTPRAPGEAREEVYRVERGGANSHLYDDRLYAGDTPIGFLDEDWSDRVLAALRPSARDGECERLREALPKTIGRVHLGERLSDGETLCSHSHDVPAGHPLYWPPREGEYPDDVDPLCLAHAIEQAESDQGWCEVCTSREFTVMLTREPTEAMMDAGLYNSSHDSDAGNVRAIWTAMFDAVALDGGMSTVLAALSADRSDQAGEVSRG